MTAVRRSSLLPLGIGASKELPPKDIRNPVQISQSRPTAVPSAAYSWGNLTESERTRRVTLDFKQQTLAASVAAIAAALFTLVPGARAEVVSRGEEGAPLHEARPAPASIYPDEHIIVAQPSPSEVNPSFLGPVLLMKSAHIDLEKGTMTVPLRAGRLASGETVWSVLTDVTDENLANLHGVNYSAKLAYGLIGKAARPCQNRPRWHLYIRCWQGRFCSQAGVDAGGRP